MVFLGVALFISILVVLVLLRECYVNISSISLGINSLERQGLKLKAEMLSMTKLYGDLEELKVRVEILEKKLAPKKKPKRKKK